MEYHSLIEDRARFRKAYMGVVWNSGSSCNIQNRFFSEGYFMVNVTPLGPSLCLLEEDEESEIHDLVL